MILSANLPMKKEDNILNKIANFFKKIFGIKDKKIYNNEEVKLNAKQNNNSFAEDIKVSNVIKENQTKELMREYERGILKDTDMTKEEITNLIELYNKEIEQLKENIDVIRLKIIAKKDKITS